MVISPKGVRDGIIKTGTEGSKKTAETIVSQGDAVKAATEKIAETVIEEGSSRSEGLGIFSSSPIISRSLNLIDI